MASGGVVWLVIMTVIAVLGTLTVARPVEDANKPASASLGSPFFDEIVVESTLTVRGKGGAARQSRGKKLQLVSTTEAAKKEAEPALEVAATQDVAVVAASVPSSAVASVMLARAKRQQGPGGRHHRPQHFGGQNQFGGPKQFNGQNHLGRPNFGGQGFPSGSASSANAAAQGFNVAGPNGFGASASNAGSQGFQFGPNGIQGNAAQSASQTYRLPNGQTLNVAFSNGFNVGPNGVNQSGANSISVTGANGQRQQLYGG